MLLTSKQSLILGALACVAIASAQSFKVSLGKVQSLSSTAFAASEKKSAGVSVGADKNSISVTGKSATLVVRTGPENDMMSFRIKGLRNPTISVPAGAKLTILFINSDEDMLH